jgi:hypothetical protein
MKKKRSGRKNILKETRYVLYSSTQLSSSPALSPAQRGSKSRSRSSSAQDQDQEESNHRLNPNEKPIPA